MLRKSDLSPTIYKRVAEADGKEVPWEEIAKRCEHEKGKGKYVILKAEDFFARVYVEATQTVDIINLVEIDNVNPEEASNVVDLVSVLQHRQGKVKANKPVTKAGAKSKPAPGKKQAA